MSTTADEAPVAVVPAETAALLDAPLVRTELPGPRSAELLARQSERESNARSYPRNLTIAIKRARSVALLPFTTVKN